MKTFFVADLHLGDDAYTLRAAGRGGHARPFVDAAAMDEALVSRWNHSVGDGDVVWVLGDIAKRGHLETVRLLRGNKKLVAGNRDPISEIAALGLFSEIHAVKFLPGLLLSHMPVHPTQLRRALRNVHGHLHARRIDDSRYLCVSVDQTDFAPVQLAGPG